MTEVHAEREAQPILSLGVGMFGKIVAGVIMGFVVAMVAWIVIGLGAGGGQSGGKAGVWAALIGFVLTMFLAVRAAGSRYAWGRGLLIAGLLCLAMPLSGVVFTGIVGAGAVSKEVTDAGRAGAAIGTAMGGTLITLVSGVVGFFLGAIFLVGSYFSLRRPA
ncbi:MAG: hypothetical protein KIS73_24640 [Enhydrobacter sp.]|nr:hypothetical protein [Enhydrobacter sp.]